MPTLSITPNRVNLARYGLSVKDLQRWLGATIGSHKVGILYEGDRRFDMVIRLADTQRENIQTLASLPVFIANQDYVLLSELATLMMIPMPSQISRENAKRKIVISSNIHQTDVSSFMHQLQKTIQEKIKLPEGYCIEYGGSFEQLTSATKKLTAVVPIILLLIFLLLYFVLNSFKEALIIFSAVPFALTGGVYLLAIRQMPLSISAAIGFVALCGIAVLNSLVMLSYIRQLYEQGKSFSEALVQGAVTRLRPVLMTALVAGMGLVPMAFNTGIGAQVQKPLATVVIGGIFTSTLLTLIVLPVLYRWAYKERL